jgi:hypothetical protein
MRKAFYCDNGGAQSIEYQKSFWRVADSLNYDGSAYGGLSLESRQSNLDREIRDAFYSADVIVALFNQDPANSWAFSELGHVNSKKIFAFVTPSINLEALSTADNLMIVADAEDFERKLKTILSSYHVETDVSSGN